MVNLMTSIGREFVVKCNEALFAAITISSSPFTQSQLFYRLRLTIIQPHPLSLRNRLIAAVIHCSDANTVK